MSDPVGRPGGVVRSALALLLSLAMLAFGATGVHASGGSGADPASAPEADEVTATWELSLRTDPAPGEQVAAGDRITYTLTANALGVRPVTGVGAAVDLAGALEHATLVEPLPAGLTRAGDGLAWDVRHPVHPDRPASVSFSVIVDDEADGVTLTSVATPQRDGGQCADCTVTHAVSAASTGAWELSVRAADARGITVPQGASLRPNELLNYHLTVQNTSSVPVADAVVVADVSGLLPYANIEALAAGAVLDADAGTVTWPVPELEPGAEAVASFRANLRFADAPNAVLPLTVSPQGGSGTCVSGCELVHHVTGFQASMSVDPPAGEVTPGGEITYTWEVANTSRAEISGATVTAQLREVFEHAELVQPLAEGLGLISITGPTLMRWEVPDLGPGETARVAFSVVVDDDAEPGAQFGTRITAGANSFGITYGEREAAHTVTAAPWEVQVAANHEPGATLLTNAAVVPRMTVTNTSGVPVSGAQVVADLAGMGEERFDLSRVPADAAYDEQTRLLTWSVPDLQPGESVTELFQVRLTPALRGAEVSIDFTAVGDGGQCVSGCEVAYHVSGFDASATADVPAGEVEPGTEITYTWQVENISGGQLSGAHVRSNLNHQNGPVLASADLVEPLADGLRMIGSVMNWDIPDLGPGESAEVSFSVLVDERATAGSQLWTRITPGTARHGGSGPGEAIVHTVGAPAWEVTARAADVRGITIPDGASLRPNGRLNYHLSAANTSGVTVRDGAVVADVSGLLPYANIEALGAGAEFDAEAGTVTWTVPDLAPGADATVSFRANLRFADAPGAVLPLSIGVVGAGGECVDGCELEHYVTALQASVHGEPAADQVRPGGTITYVWEVENTSRAQVSGAYVRAQMGPILEHARIVDLPADVDFAVGTTLNWDVPDLAPGQRAQVSFTVVVDDEVEPGTDLTMSITAGPNALGVSYDAQSVSHTVAPAVTPPSIPPLLAVLLGLAKFLFGLLIWLF